MLSNGAKQVLHPLFHSEWFPCVKKVILSDHFLTKSGYYPNINHKKITIIGGSHSGFSCAWLILNGPEKMENVSVKIIYRDKIRVFYDNIAAAEKDGYEEYDPLMYSKRENCVYGFTGLRSDAKALY